MKENNDIFFAGGDALVYFVTNARKKLHNICLGPSI